MNTPATLRGSRLGVKPQARSAAWVAVFAILLMLLGGCLDLGPPVGGDDDTQGFRSATISRCRVVLQVSIETDIALSEASADGTPTSMGHGIDISEVFYIDVDAAEVVAAYDEPERRFRATWDGGAYHGTSLELVLDDSGTAILSLTLAQTVAEEAGIYALTRQWEFDAEDLPYVGDDVEHGVWFRVNGEQTCGALSALSYRRDVTASGYTVVEQMSSVSCNERSLLEVYLLP